MGHEQHGLDLVHQGLSVDVACTSCNKHIRGPRDDGVLHRLGRYRSGCQSRKHIQLPAEAAKICKISGEERANGALPLNGAAEDGVSVSLGKPPANEMDSEREEETGDYLE